MRIIDKNVDFYDYIQGTDTTGELVFDRTDSFMLTKEELARHLLKEDKWDYKKRQWITKTISYNFLLLQAGNKFWLFLVTVPEEAKDYKLTLISNWDNYNCERALIKLDVIEFDWSIRWEVSDKTGFRRDSEIDMDRLKEKADILVQAVNTKNYKERQSLNYYSYFSGDGKQVEKHIPILKACGISNFIAPMEFYMAIDEYFSLEKQASEKTDAEGTTNNDKIVNHGFDTKTSFRGKV